jgi:hypothetical protein
MDLLNVAVMRVLVATPVTTGLLAKGAVADTLGGWDVMGPEPKMGSLLPPHAVMKRTLARASDQGALPLQSLNVRIKRLQSQFSAMSEGFIGSVSASGFAPPGDAHMACGRWIDCSVCVKAETASVR